MSLRLGSKSKILRWCAAALVAILLGAIGSGVWQGLLGPAVRAVLSVASLGLRSYKDAVYQQIAAGYPAPASMVGAWTSTAVLEFVLLLLISESASRYQRVKSRLERAAGLSDEGASPGGAARAGVQGAEQEGADQRRLGRMRKLLYALVVLSTLLLVIQTTSLARASYVSSATANYRQSLEVDLPYLGPQDLAQIESRFAQVRSRRDYVAVIGQLDSVAEAHRLRVPAFTPWRAKRPARRTPRADCLL